MDLNDCSLTTMPITALRRFLSAVQTNFRGRGFKVCVLNASMMIRGSWSMIKGWMDEFTAQKLVMMDSTYKKQLPQFIADEQLEERFGGKSPNKTAPFFPPHLTVPGEEMMTREEFDKRSGKVL